MINFDFVAYLISIDSRSVRRSGEQVGDGETVEKGAVEEGAPTWSTLAGAYGWRCLSWRFCSFTSSLRPHSDSN